MGRLGDMEAEMALILPMASGNVQTLGSSELPASVRPRHQQPHCFRPDAAPASPALQLFPLCRAGASLERQRRARHGS